MVGRSTAGLLTTMALLGVVGCELAEVTTVAGEDVVVVEAVLRTDREVQTILLHRSLADGTAGGEAGARVAVLTGGGREIVFQPAPLSSCARIPRSDTEVAVTPACYRSPDTSLGWVAPGGAYQLRVETADGRVLRGRTVVPGSFELRNLPVAARPDESVACEIPPNTPLPLVWSRAAGAWSYLATLQVFGLRQALAGAEFKIPDPVKLTGLAISESDTTLTVPGDFGLFERADFDERLLIALRDGFPADVSARVTLAAADRNYVNAVRGGAFNPSGMVRVSSVTGGGGGVFASLNPIELEVQVRPGPVECHATSSREQAL